MVYLRRLMIALAILPLFAAMLPVRAADATSVQSMLTTYYNNISLQHYQDAYPMWVNSPQTYADFVAGYGGTDHVTPYLGDYEPDNADNGYVPAVLVGYHVDGTIVAYHGCFNVLARPDWAITSASFDLISDEQPDNDLILSYLATDCASSETVFPTLQPTATSDPLSNVPKAYDALNAYYAILNKRDFANAYGLWLHPISGPKPNGAPAEDYRPSYNDFVAGYASTKFVDVYAGTYDEEGASMGHGYLDGEMPVMLIGEHFDGTYVGYIGCFVMGSMEGIDMGIVSGSFQQISTGPDFPSVKEYLPSLNTICDTVSANLKF